MKSVLSATMAIPIKILKLMYGGTSQVEYFQENISRKKAERIISIFYFPVMLTN